MKDINFLKRNHVDVNQSLELFGDIETYNETIKEFQMSIDGKLEQIEKYYKEEDMPNYAIYVHSLKSDCKYFGFMELANLAYEHEIKSKENNVTYVKENYIKLIMEAQRVRAIINEYLGIEEATEKCYTENELLNEDIILVADDSEIIRIFVTKIFDAAYAIEVAKDGEEALRIIKENESNHKIKAILLDLNMPKVDGFAVLEYMKEKDLFKQMPVTIVSGDSSSEAIHKAFTYDIVDMLNKPFSEEKIKEIVEKTMQSAR